MKNIKSIQCKAAILMIVFSMNTIIGFACAMGLDMGFNAHHHEGSEGIIKKTSHHHNTSHHHDAADNDHHKSKGNKDDCCNDRVMKFTQLDKTVPHSLNLVHPVFFTALVSAFYNIDVPFLSRSVSNIKYFVRSYHPPIPDIRIAIQSFQI